MSSLKELKKQQASINAKIAKFEATETPYNSWYKKQGLTAVEKVQKNLPTKDGMKTFNGLKLSNGRTAVYVKGGSVLKYAWA
jgi:hypothetical protein